MANRRMFSIRIINSAKFLRMPVSCQALYFHLGIHADDDGIVEAYPVIKSVGCNEDDLKVLVGKGFLQVLNEDLVCYITDWNENNQIRPDRKIDSIYKDLLVSLNPDVKLIESRPRADKKASGQPTDNQVTTSGQPKDNQRTANGQPMDSIGKDSIGKYRLGKDRLEDEFDQIWSAYPKRQGKQNAFKAFQKAIKEGESVDNIKAGLQAFLAYIKAYKVDHQYIPMGSTWFNQKRWNDDYSIRESNRPTRKGSFFAPTGYEDEYARVNAETLSNKYTMADATEEELIALGIGTKLGGEQGC